MGSGKGRSQGRLSGFWPERLQMMVLASGDDGTICWDEEDQGGAGAWDASDVQVEVLSRLLDMQVQTQGEGQGWRYVFRNVQYLL